MSSAYKEAGVDVHAGYEAVSLIKGHVKRTLTDGVLSDIGGFGGLFEIGQGYKNPVLVSGTDGVGTKLRLAFLMREHRTIGQDCVAMCVNDIACAGARPLFFLDYLAMGKNIPTKVADIVGGVADGCELAGCALIGGETAEMPGFYPEDEYDLAGFSVGIVEKDKIIDKGRIKAGDALIGLESSGVHSNGFSLVRKVFGLNDADACEELNTYYDCLGKTLGEELLTPTKIYVKVLLSLVNEFEIHGISHITGGGFYENIPRMLPEGLTAVVDKKSVLVPPVFELIRKTGNISEQDMFNTFNMGTGIVMAVKDSEAERILSHISALGEKGRIIGEITEGSSGLELRS